MHLSLALTLGDYLPANPAAEYRHRSGQLIFAFGIGRSVRISHGTAELFRPGYSLSESERFNLSPNLVRRFEEMVVKLIATQAVHQPYRADRR